MWKMAFAICTMALSAGACGSSTGGHEPLRTQPDKLIYEGDCTSAACPAPAGQGSLRCTKAGSGDACTWSGDPDTSVGWRVCAAQECGEKPNIVCAPGLDILSQQCGSLRTPTNEGSCAWHS